jgi:hypothetical protein
MSKVMEALREAGNPVLAHMMLRQCAEHPHAGRPILSFIRAVQSILCGQHDEKLAHAPEFNYAMTAEILLLLEILQDPTRLHQWLTDWPLSEASPRETLAKTTAGQKADGAALQKSNTVLAGIVRKFFGRP